MTRPDYPLHDNQAFGADRRTTGDGFGHVIWPCLMASVMCHVFLVAITSGYGEQHSGAELASERIAARLDTPVAHAVQTPARILAPKEVELVSPEKLAAPTPPSPPAKLEEGTTAPFGQAGSKLDADAVSAYIPSELLSVKPRILDTPESILPVDLAPDEHGRVVVQLLINTEGAVDRVLLQGSELSAAGTRLFIQRLSNLHLEPGQLNGVPSKALYRLEFNVQASSPERSSAPR